MVYTSHRKGAFRSSRLPGKQSVSVPILTTKLHIPLIRPQRVARPDLIERMNTGLSRDDGGFTRVMTYVSAPAGYGKTTQVIDWLKSIPGLGNAVAWLSLDQNDNDSTRFLATLIVAIQVIHPGFGGKTLGMLQSPQQPPAEVILATLINEIAAIPTPFILVLDDYHDIQDSTIHQQVTFLLENQPPCMHLVLVTREDPLLPLARLRAQGKMLEIRGDDLRFSSQECEVFLGDIMGVSLTSDQIGALVRRTEGWIVGLQLAALSLQGHINPAHFVADFTGSSRFILDYLVDEVYQRQSQKVRSFLLKTAILDQLCGPLCDAVAGDSNSQGILETLEQANLFIIPLDQSRTWYRYHRLFADLLLHRLRGKQTILLADLHNRASEWFEENGYPSQAIDHAISAGAWSHVGTLLLRVSTEMLKHGEVATLIRWYRAFPEEVLLGNPKLCFDYAWPLLLSGQYKEAAPLLDHVERAADDIPEFLGEVMAAQAYLARGQSDHERMVERSQRAMELLPETSLDSRGLVAINLGLAYWHMGQMQAAEKVLEEAFEAGRVTGNHYATLTALIFNGRVAAVRGQLGNAAKLARQAIAHGGEIPINALAHLDLSALYYEWDKLVESEQHIQSAIDLSQRGRNDEFLTACWMLSARLHQARGDLQEGRQALTQAHELVHTGKIPPATAARVAAAQVRFSLAEGDLETALEWAHHIDDHSDCHNFLRFLGLTRVQLLIAQNDIQEAQDILHLLHEAAKADGWGYGLVAVRIWQALAADDQETALVYLTEALQQATHERFIRSFVDVGDELVPILIKAAQNGIEPSFVSEILSAMQGGKISPSTPDQSALVEVLSPRELEVLHLVAAGLSNRQIAAQLVISPGTAKTHVHNICGKLGVRNRTQAATKAKDLDLF